MDFRRLSIPKVEIIGKIAGNRIVQTRLSGGWATLQAQQSHPLKPGIPWLTSAPKRNCLWWYMLRVIEEWVSFGRNR